MGKNVLVSQLSPEELEARRKYHREYYYLRKTLTKKDISDRKSERYSKSWEMNPELKRAYHRKYIRNWRINKPGQREKERQRAKEYKKRTGQPKRYYQANKDKYKEYNRLARQRHPERYTKYCADWRKRVGQDYIRAQAKARYYKDREHYVLKSIRYRVRRKGAKGTSTVEQRLARVEYHGWQCRYCKCQLTPENLTIDHMIPLARGGSDWPANLVPACKPCNSKKRIKTYKEFKEFR